ncbi:MAG TPA: PucR family transcriptional regulator ligand-binding domain-containing protein [Trebonia sp.]|jgi:purine catabolism regulator|nr:PucR family transcriptional regulator ligand-binding domain-containing protein [Trebonia sp.]
MPVTISQVVALPELALRVAAGSAGLDREVRLVHTSEVEDPTPWLSGGELLLTTGMRLRGRPEFAAYVRRLAAAGVSGVGFGTGVRHASLPRALSEAAETEGLPVLEVPYETPFVAISEAVSSRLAADQASAAARTQEIQRELTRRTVDAGPWEGLLPYLARVLGCWCAVVDAADVVLAAAPRDAASTTLSAVRPYLDRVRSLGPRGAGSWVGPDKSVMVQPLATGQHVHGYLLAGKTTPFGSLDQAVAGFAVSLLSLELARARSVSRAEQRFRSRLAGMLLAGQLPAETGREAITAWGLSEGALRVCVCVPAAAAPASAASPDAIRALAEAAADIPGIVCAPAGPDELIVLASGTDEAAALSGRAAAVSLRTGVSAPADAGQLTRALREARLAAQVAAADDRQHTWFGELDPYQVLVSGLDRDALRVYADAVLGALERHDVDGRGELVRSLEALLRHGEHWERAAADLGVHRNTLRYRMRRVEELSGRQLSSQHARMEFWLALQLRRLAGDG